MSDVTLSRDDLSLLVEIVGASYRNQHRERWEVEHLGGDARSRDDAAARLSRLEVLLIKIGGRPEDFVQET